MTIGLALLYVCLMLAKAVLAFRYPRPAPSREPVTIVQPILSGDPLLEPMLARNLAMLPEAQFLWMIDDNDAEALRIGDLYGCARLSVVRCAPPRDGENPKLVKLIRALDLVTTERLIVLDDDTCLTEPLPTGDLVTGLPVFTAKSTTYERLIGGFVNGSALLTYLPAAQLRLQRTINGMIYAVDTAQLRALGGFDAAGHALTDDYAVAQLYQRQGLAITQATTPAHVAMTVASAAHYVRVMRRWMIFAARYFGDNATLATIFWIGLPGLLPLAGFVLAPWAFGPLLLLKALLNRILLWRATGFTSTFVDVVFECLAELLTPLFMLLAFIQPNQLTWRTRTIQMDNGKIRYQ